MKNLEKIKKAWAMGWSATMKDGSYEYQIVSCFKLNETFGVVLDTGHASYVKFDSVEEDKIIGYKYAGELAGNEDIPEGQKFKVKKNGEIHDVSELRNVLGMYRKSEIEPYFE